MKDTIIYPDEFIPGEYYFTTEAHKNHNHCIVKYNNNEPIYFININTGIFGESYNKAYAKYARLATSDEIDWLNYCIKEKWFISEQFVQKLTRNKKLLLI